MKEIKEQNMKKIMIVLIVEMKKSDKPPKRKKVRMKLWQKQKAAQNDSQAMLD